MVTVLYYHTAVWLLQRSPSSVPLLGWSTALARRCDHVTLLQQLHWVSAPEREEFKLSVWSAGVCMDWNLNICRVILCWWTTSSLVSDCARPQALVSCVHDAHSASVASRRWWGTWNALSPSVTSAPYSLLLHLVFTENTTFPFTNRPHNSVVLKKRECPYVTSEQHQHEVEADRLRICHTCQTRQWKSWRSWCRRRQRCQRCPTRRRCNLAALSYSTSFSAAALQWSAAPKRCILLNALQRCIDLFVNKFCKHV